MVSNRIAIPTLLALGIALAGPVSGAAPMQRQAALALAQGVETEGLRQFMLDATIAGNTAEVLALLEHTSLRPDWPAPAVDAVIHDFAQQLRALPRAAVPAEVLAWLVAYEPRAWVVHEEHVTDMVPLFNVRGVAVGVENDWRRQDALLEGLALIASHPRSLVDAWLIESHPASRLGYLQAIAQARPNQLRDVGQYARLRLDGHPELTALAGQAALRDGDVPALGEVFVFGGGPDLTPLMREAARTLPPEASAALLDSTVTSSTGISAALAIAELAPAASSLPSTQELLIAQLDDRRLGPTAAMALARVATPESLTRLQNLAKGKAGNSARLAQYALDLHAADTREAPQR